MLLNDYYYLPVCQDFMIGTEIYRLPTKVKTNQILISINKS